MAAVAEVMHTIQFTNGMEAEPTARGGGAFPPPLLRGRLRFWRIIGETYLLAVWWVDLHIIDVDSPLPGICVSGCLLHEKE